MSIASLGAVAGSALNAFSVAMMVRANNIANMNTPGFSAQNTVLATGADGTGVSVGRIATEATSGAQIPENVGYPGVSTAGSMEMSNTDPAREFVSMISTQRAYEANTVTIRTADEMAGTLLDMKV